MKEHIKLKIICETPLNLSVDELSRFLYYFNNLYKIIYFSENGEVDSFYNLKGIKDEDKLRILVITKESPLIFVALIPLLAESAKLFKEFLEIIKIIRDWDLDRELKETYIEKEKLEIKKLELLITELEKITRLKEIKIKEVEENA
jgi:hypothetical protein